MEQALRESEERYRLISSESTALQYSCMQTADRDLIIDWATTSADQVFGYSLDEIMAKGCWRHLVHPDDFAEFDRNIAYLAPGQRSECELRILAKDGPIQYIHSYTLAMEAADDQAGNRLNGDCQDITARRQAEARIEFLAHHD